MAERRRPAGGAGFSLLEALIAIGLVALVAVALSGGLRLGARAWETQARATARHADLDPPRALLARLLTTAVLLEGTPRTVRAVTRLPASLEAEGLSEALLTLVPDGRLVLAWRPWRRGATSPPPFAEVELARGVQDIALEYFGAPAAAVAAAPPGGGEANAGAADAAAAAGAAAAPPAWVPSWEGGAAPPLLVRVRLALAPGDPRRWPELVAAPRLAKSGP